MPTPENENKVEDPREQWLDDLLAGDRRQLQRAAEERIAGGMYRRIVQAQAERGHDGGGAWRWAMMCAGVALMALMVWVAIPRKTAPPLAVGFGPLPGPMTGSVKAPVASNSARQTTPRHPTLGSMQGRVAAQPARNSVPKQAVFPSNIVPTEEERLLMDLARNHPEQLQEISEIISDQEKQEKEQSQAFEKWLRQGEQR